MLKPIWFLLVLASFTLAFRSDLQAQENYENVHLIVDDKLIAEGDIFKIIEPLYWSVSIYDGPGQYESDLSKFSKNQRYVFAIHWYGSEVYNGGHEQFYFNSTGIVWEDALIGFQKMGLQDLYEILNASAQRFQSKPSKNRERRNQVMEKLEINFDDLDSKFYEIREIESRMLEYIQKNRKDFYFDGEVKRPKN